MSGETEATPMATASHACAVVTGFLCPPVAALAAAGTPGGARIEEE
ncbi:hypothetical protein [Streptomyces sp. SudanB182_2057]